MGLSPEPEPEVQLERLELHLHPLGAVPQDLVLTSAGSGVVSGPSRNPTPRVTKGNRCPSLWDSVPSQSYSPPCDLELIDGTFAVVVIDKVLVTHPDALVVHSEALR